MTSSLRAPVPCSTAFRALAGLRVRGAQGRTASVQGRETAAEAEAAVAALNTEELASMNAASNRSSDCRRSGAESPRGFTHVRCAAAAAGGRQASQARPDTQCARPFCRRSPLPPRDSLQHGSSCCRRSMPGCRAADVRAAVLRWATSARCWVTCGAWGWAQGVVHAAGVPQREAV